MSRNKTALDVSGLARPVCPSPEDMAEIIRSFGLSEKQVHELRLVINHFMMDIDAYLAELDRIPPRPERAGRLRRIEKALRRVQYEVERSEALLDHILPFDLSEDLGGKLTFAAIGAAIGSPQAPRQFRHTIAVIAERDGDLSMKTVEEAFDAERRSLGLKHGGAIFRSMVNDLYAPLGRWVELDKKVAGRKPMMFRNLLIERLAYASEDVLGHAATSTAKGPFVRLCAAVLDAVQLPSDGVEKAVETIIRKRRERERHHSHSRS